MTETRPPGTDDEALEERYRRASEADASRPSEATRSAILAHARTVAASRRASEKPSLDTSRPAANDRFWWRSAAAGIVVAGLALMLWAPHLDRMGHEDKLAAPAAASSAEEMGAPPAAAPATAATAAPAPAAAVADRAAEMTIAKAATPRPAVRPAPVDEPVPPPPAPAESRALAAVPAAAPEEPASKTLANVTQSERSAGAVAARSLRAPSAFAAAAAPAPAPARDASADAGANSAALGSASRQRAGQAIVATDLLAPGEEQVPGALQRRIAAGDALRTYLLLLNGAPVEGEDAAGDTPLLVAVRVGNLEIVQMLVKDGADVNALDRNGKSPLDRARRLKHADIAAFLESHGAH